MKIVKNFLFCLATLFISTAAFSSSITLDSKWVVMQVKDSALTFASNFQAGQLLSMKTILELNTTDSNPDELFGQYNGAITNISLIIGTTVFSGNGSVSIKALSSYVFGQHASIQSATSDPFEFVSFTDLTVQTSDALTWMISAPPRWDSSYAWITLGNAEVWLQQ